MKRPPYRVDRRRAQPLIRPSRSPEDRAILVDLEPFGPSVEVWVEPPLIGRGNFGRAFSNGGAARRYAGELQSELRLDIVDRTGGSN